MAAGWRDKIIKSEKYFPSWTLPANHSLVMAAKNTYRALFNKNPRIGKWTFSTNGVSSMGRLGIPTIGFGPVEERFTHSMQDKVAIKQLEIAAAFYAALPFFFSTYEGT